MLPQQLDQVNVKWQLAHCTAGGVCSVSGRLLFGCLAEPAAVDDAVMINQWYCLKLGLKRFTSVPRKRLRRNPLPSIIVLTNVRAISLIEQTQLPQLTPERACVEVGVVKSA